MSQAPSSSAPYQFQQPQPPYGQSPYDQSKMGDAPPPYPGQGAGQAPYPVPGHGYAPPPAGMAPQPAVHAYYMAPGQATSTTTTTVIITGNCPKCHVGHLREENNAAMCILVAILAFLFFPIGLLYFLCLPAAVIHHCDNCGYTC